MDKGLDCKAGGWIRSKQSAKIIQMVSSLSGTRWLDYIYKMEPDTVKFTRSSAFSL